MVTTSHIRVKFVPLVEADKHMFTAYCNELGLAASDYTRQTAVAKLNSMVRSFFNSLQRKGLLKKALIESGIHWEECPRQLEKGEEEVEMVLYPANHQAR